MNNPIFALLRILTCAFAGVNPSVAKKQKTLVEYAAAAQAAGTFAGASVEVPRGASNIKFSLDGELFDRTTGDETYTYKIQTRAKSSDGWQDVAGAAFTTIAAVSGSQQVPSPANAPGVVIQRYIRTHLTTVGNTPINTSKIVMLYDLDVGPGLDANINYYGG